MVKWTNKWAKMDEETRPFFFIFAHKTNEFVVYGKKN